MIIWDDYSYGKELQKIGHLKTKKWQYKELKALGFYLLCEGVASNDIRIAMEKICNDDIKYLSDSQKDTIFSKLIAQCEAEPFHKNSEIVIYKEELDFIMLLKQQESKQLIFTLLVYKKWLDSIHKNNYEWFACLKQDIFTEAKLTNCNSNKKSALLNDLINKNYLCSEVKKLSKGNQKKEHVDKKQMWSIPFLCKEGTPALKISNYINVVNHYFSYTLGGYFTCKRCLGLFKRKSNRQCYCSNCKKENKVKKSTLEIGTNH